MDYNSAVQLYFNVTRLDTVLFDDKKKILSKRVTIAYPREIQYPLKKHFENIMEITLKLNPEEYRQIFFSDFHVYYMLLRSSENVYAICGPYCYKDKPVDIIYKILNIYHIPKQMYNEYQKWHQQIPLNFRPLPTNSSLMFTILKNGVCSGRCIDSQEVPDSVEIAPRDYLKHQTSRNILNQYAIEDRIRTAIQKGNTSMVLQELADSGNRFEYRSDGLTLWHMQHMVTVMGTVMRIAAREGGVPAYVIHEISERYFYRIRGCKNEGELEALLPKMAKDYCHAVQYAKLESFSPIVQAAISYLHLHYREPLTLEIIAGSIPCHPNYLCKCFKKETGITIIQALTDIRLDYACLELQSSTVSITAVSEMVGFESYSHFSNVFKKKFHCSCSQWRKKKAGYL